MVKEIERTGISVVHICNHSGRSNGGSMKTLLVTNNATKAAEYYKQAGEVLHLPDATYLDVLWKARDLIHLGRSC